MAVAAAGNMLVASLKTDSSLDWVLHLVRYSNTQRDKLNRNIEAAAAVVG